MLFVRLTTCCACLLLVSCSELVGVEDWTPMPAATQPLEAGLEAPDGTTHDVLPGKDVSSYDTNVADSPTGADAHAEAEAASPDLCEAGAWRCDQASLVHCGGTPAEWTTVQVCATAALCSAWKGTCREPVCAPGEYTCDGRKLMLCNAGRDGWVMKDYCSKELVCDASKGRCAVCVAGSMACQGADLLLCTDDGAGTQVLKTCATGEICDATLGTCSAGPDQ